MSFFCRHASTDVSACQWSGTASITASMSLRRSEEHTSELQSQSNLVCRLLLEKKKNKKKKTSMNSIKQTKIASSKLYTPNLNNDIKTSLPSTSYPRTLKEQSSKN